MSDDSAQPPPGGAAGGARAMIGILALAVIGLGGWLVWDLTRDEAASTDEGSLAQLPEPAEPRTRAMVAVGGGTGWTWVNPLPRSMPTWYAVDATDDGERVMLVGHAGAAVRYEAQALTLVDTGTDATLRGVAWLGADALVVGEEGTILRVGPDGVASIDGVDATLRGVTATEDGQAVVVGDDGTLLEVGETARVLDARTDAHLLGAFARGGAVHVVGDGVALRLEGGAVTSETVPVTSTLRGVGGCARGPVYAVGDGGVMLRRLPDGGWTRLATHLEITFTDVACDHGRVAAVGEDGRVLLLSGDDTLLLPSGFDRTWHAVDGGERGPTWIAGTGGRLATIEADHVRTRTAGPAVPIRDLDAISGALVAVGEWGRILRQNETGFRQAESPTDAGLAALIPVNERQLIAVGDFGAIVDIRFDRTELVGSPTRSSLRDGVATGQRRLFVGAGGTVVRGREGSLEATVIPDAGDLWAVVGSPDRAYAVGDDGLVILLTAEGFSRVDCDTEADLRDVAFVYRVGNLAVGTDGTILRIGDDGCTVERTGGADLHAVGYGPLGQAMAGGDDGTVLLRSADGSWSPAPVDVLGASIRSIWRSSRNVYLAGSGGVIVRHVRVDGMDLLQ